MNSPFPFRGWGPPIIKQWRFKSWYVSLKTSCMILLSVIKWTSQIADVLRITAATFVNPAAANVCKMQIFPEVHYLSLCGFQLFFYFIYFNVVFCGIHFVAWNGTFMFFVFSSLVNDLFILLFNLWLVFDIFQFVCFSFHHLPVFILPFLCH